MDNYNENFHEREIKQKVQYRHHLATCLFKKGIEKTIFQDIKTLKN